MNWPTVPLGELCKMDRQGVRPDDPDASLLPFIGLENIEPDSGNINFNNDTRIGNQKSTSFRFDKRHILYGKLRPYLNKVAAPTFTGKCSTELVPLLPQVGVDREFLGLLLRRQVTVEYVMSSVTGARMPRTDMRALLSLAVPFPPLEEQRRIVSILNRAAKIERLRNQAQERLREFIPALFIRMFGDPVENPMGWKTCQLGNLIQGLQGGRNVKAGNGSSKFRILKVSAVTDGIFNPSETKPAPDDYVPPIDHFVRPGDLLISRANTSALVGSSAMVEGSSQSLLLPDKIWRFVWHEDSCVEPVYIHNYLKISSTRVMLSAMATGTSGSMKNISQAKLKTLPILVPPLGIQQQFVKMIKTARSAASIAKAGSSHVAVLNPSLLFRLLRYGV